jgi:3'-phosphoadenosine 5'-phosphosulfate sulfotransferase
MAAFNRRSTACYPPVTRRLEQAVHRLFFPVIWRIETRGDDLLPSASAGNLQAPMSPVWPMILLLRNKSALRADILSAQNHKSYRRWVVGQSEIKAA